jgi:hypothetical protein
MSDTTGANTFAINESETNALAIYGRGGKLLVHIDLKDGEVSFGPDYNPDDAARVFWTHAIGDQYRAFLAWKASQGQGGHERE